MFVVENGGSLNANSVIFDLSSSDGGSHNMTDASPTTSVSVYTMISTTSASEGVGGVRAIYTAGSVTVENCDFVGSGDLATEAVINGGAVRFPCYLRLPALNSDADGALFIHSRHSSSWYDVGAPWVQTPLRLIMISIPTSCGNG